MHKSDFTNKLKNFDIFSLGFFSFCITCFNVYFTYYIIDISVFPKNIENNIMYFALMSSMFFNLILTIVLVLFYSKERFLIRLITSNVIFFLGFFLIIAQRDFLFKDIYEERVQNIKIQKLEVKLKKLESLIRDKK